MNPENYQRGYYNLQPYNTPADAIAEEASIGSKTGNYLLDDWLKKSKRKQHEINRILRKLKRILEDIK